MEQKLADVIYQQYGLAALILAGFIAIAFAIWHEAWKLREEVAYQVGRDLLGKRFDAYGELWACMKPIALYGEGRFGPMESRALREALANWYFSSHGGLFLTARAREFYFALQDLLADLSVLPNWHCDARPRDSKHMFVQVVGEAEGIPERAAIFAGLEAPERLPPTEWKRCCRAVASHLAGLVARNNPTVGDLIFASVQQVSSVLRTVLTRDVLSRFDVDLPSEHSLVAVGSAGLPDASGFVAGAR